MTEILTAGVHLPNGDLALIEVRVPDAFDGDPYELVEMECIDLFGVAPTYATWRPM